MKAMLALILAAATVARAELNVTEYFGATYHQEPVSFDVPWSRNLGLAGVPSQVEVLEPGKTVRLWTLVDVTAPGRQSFTLGNAVEAKVSWGNGELTTIGGIQVATVGNGQFYARVPVGSVKFPEPVSAFSVPGPVVAVSADGQAWYGSGYLDSLLRVREVRCELNVGPVFWQSRITYLFENDRQYVAQVRIYRSKPYAQLVEDFNLGGASRFVFNYEDWFPQDFISCTDQAQTKHRRIGRHDAGDFIREEGSTCLVRLVVWSQFGYFNGKSETIGLMNEDGSLAVGGFLVRPDRWTRAKVNHVALYRRPEVPGDRMTRGIVGLQGARDRLALEAWLVDGHREWAIFAMPAGSWKTPPSDTGDGEFQWHAALRKAHVREGVWPLDRLNRLILNWHGNGVPTAPAGGDAQTVLVATQGRSGLQMYNGSEGRLRGTAPNPAGWNGQVNPTTNVATMAATAINAYLSADESAYPGVRAMLPWTHPEALNPFYQGMENMNFNADLYRYTLTFGLRLAALGHPEARRFIEHGQQSFDMALDRYVYPQSGCWEESHGYAGHTIKTVAPMVQALKNTAGYKDFTEDVRFARMLEFFIYAHSPRDLDFGRRVIPPVGDHGLSTDGPARRFGKAVDLFTAAKNPEVQRIVRQIAWMIQEDGGSPPAGIAPEKPDLRSRWLQGYGAVLRGFRDQGQAESFLVVRAGQSWGHHHEDKGSLWGWFRNVHFFGDASWGGPPGGTYWNKYKQGPAGHTQLEFVGINNWTLPCKFPAPWISDEQYTNGFDYVNARCLFPYNPALDLTVSTPVALHNGYDRQVLFVHPDLMIVRDNVQTTCPTIWRLHSFQPKGTTTSGPRATLASPHGVTGQLHMLHPEGAQFELIDHDDLNPRKPDQTEPAKFGSSVLLKWEMPRNTSATWTFGVHGPDEATPVSQRLDPLGRVTKIKLADGREIIAFLNAEPFEFRGDGLEFAGTVALVIREKGQTALHPIRVTRLAQTR